ncbi:MAG: MltA domain-containing protein [Sideroxydans sp.]|jgi:membrane-bound lytic murein transglycosylase A
MKRAYFGKSTWLMLYAAVGLSACQTKQAPICPPTPPVITEPIKPVGKTSPDYLLSEWSALPDWLSQELPTSWPALQQSCRALKLKPVWLPICAAADKIDKNDLLAQRTFYETWFTPYQALNPDGSDTGLITGYYEPLIKGSRTRSASFPYAIYAPPDDMLEVDMGELFPQFRGKVVRARLQGKRVVPYFNRAEVDAGNATALRGKELFYVGNAVELFFLQIQGSGRIELEDGTRAKIGYAEQNGHPYASIGRKLIDMGELKPEEASMQGIKEWAEKNPDRLPILLGHNPSYVFFRELPDNLSGPLGALGVPLTNEYSIAVDRNSVPLGVPVFLASTQPNSTEPLNRLVFAQDTGGAIKGAVRADFFWGFGDIAGSKAGRMRQSGRMWVLFPKGGEPTLN